MPAMALQNFYEQLKRRRVIRVATLYVIAFWPIVQVVDIISTTFSLPDSYMRYLVFAFSGALPVVLIMAWVFDLDRDGLHVDDGKSPLCHESANFMEQKRAVIQPEVIDLDNHQGGRF